MSSFKEALSSVFKTSHMAGTEMLRRLIVSNFKEMLSKITEIALHLGVRCKITAQACEDISKATTFIEVTASIDSISKVAVLEAELHAILDQRDDDINRAATDLNDWLRLLRDRYMKGGSLSVLRMTVLELLALEKAEGSLLNYMHLEQQRGACRAIANGDDDKVRAMRTLLLFRAKGSERVVAELDRLLRGNFADFDEKSIVEVVRSATMLDELDRVPVLEQRSAVAAAASAAVTTHTIAAVQGSGAGAASGDAVSRRGNKKKNKKVNLQECSACGKHGHDLSQCWSRLYHKCTKCLRFHPPDYVEFRDTDGHCVCIKRSSKPPLPQYHTTLSFLFDTGAAYCVVNRRELLHNLVQSESSKHALVMADGSECHAIAQGTLRMKLGNTGDIIEMPCLLLPEAMPILSGSMLVQAGLSCKINKNGARLSRRGGAWIGSLFLKNGLFMIDMHVQLSSPINSATTDGVCKSVSLGIVADQSVYSEHAQLKRMHTAAGAGVEVPVAGKELHAAAVRSRPRRMDLHQLHMALSHASAQRIKDTLRCVQGVELAAAEDTALQECTYCLSGKRAAADVPRGPSQKRATKPLDELFIDTMGPFESQIGAKSTKTWLRTYLDSASRFLTVDVVHSMDAATAVTSFLRFDADVGRVQAVRMDRGTEQCNQAMHEVFTRLGISVRKTDTDASWQLGLLERVHRTMQDAARSMLLQAGLPESFLVYAMQQYVFCHNRMSTSGLKQEQGGVPVTPFEMLMGKQPRIDHIIPFGAVVWCLNRRARKSDPVQRRPAIFVGNVGNDSIRVVDPLRNFAESVTRDFRLGKINFAGDYFSGLKHGERMIRQDGGVARDGPTAQEEGELHADSDEDGGLYDDDFVDSDHYEFMPGALASDIEDNIDGEDAAMEENVEDVEHSNEDPVQPRHQPKRAQPEDTDISEQSGLQHTPHDAPSQARPVTPTSSSREFAEDPAETRYPRRNRRPPTDKYTTHSTKTQISDAHGLLAVRSAQNTDDAPRGFAHAVRSKHAEQWWDAMKRELSQFQVRGVYSSEQSVPPGNVALQTMWVYTTKPDGTRKARLVVRGDMEPAPAFPWATYASTSTYASFRLLLALAVQLQLRVVSADVSNAYLYSKLQEPVWVHPPRGFEHLGPYWQLHRCVYGLTTAAAAWQKTLTEFLCSYGLQRLMEDDCVFVSNPHSDGGRPMDAPHGKLPTRGFFLVSVVVDDIAIATEFDDDLDRFMQAFGERFEHKFRGDIANHIGFEISGKTREGRIKITQQKAIESLLLEMQMADCNPAQVPAEQKRLSVNDGPAVKASEFKSVVGKLNWLATISRPDIACAVRALSMHQGNPSNEHWQALKRVLRYLKGSQDHGLIYDRAHMVDAATRSVHKFGDGLRLAGCSDADFAGDLSDRVSVSGFVVGFQGLRKQLRGESHVDLINVFFWSSAKQSRQGPAYGTVEAEAYSFGCLIREVMHYRKMMRELGLAAEKLEPSLVFLDNSPLVSALDSGKRVKALKHIDTMDMIIYRRIHSGVVQPIRVPGTDNPADILTKPLPKLAFRRCCKWLMGEWAPDEVPQSRGV